MARGVSGWITLRALLARNGGIEPKTTDADPTALHGRVASSEVCQTNKHTSEGRHILWLLSLHEHFRPFFKPAVLDLFHQLSECDPLRHSLFIRCKTQANFS